MTNIFFLNTVTKCDKHFLKHIDLFIRSKFIFRQNMTIWLPFKNKFQDRRKIGLEYLEGTYINTETFG